VADNPSMIRRIDIRNASICVAVLAAAILIVWPVADLPYSDGTAYTYVALNLARHGHFAYNGWEAALLIFQAYWGALFIHLFGYSFECVRFSTLPFSFGAVIFCYLLVRQMGLQARSALFVTLLFGLSPIFLPVSVSYMTDAPTVFFMFASLYLLSRAAQVTTAGHSLSWLVLGAVLAFVGGTSRQVVWLVPLVVLPYLAWVRRRQIWFVIASLLTWILLGAGVAGVILWSSRQPYIIPQPSVFHEIKHVLRNPLFEITWTGRLLLMLLLICLPAALPLALRASVDTWRGASSRKLLVAALLLAVAAAIFIHPSLASIPWIANTLNWEGINGTAPLPGRPIVLTPSIRAVVAVTVYVVACLLAGELTNFRTLARRVWAPFLDPSGNQFTLVAMGLVSVTYFALMVLRDADFAVYDRYLLPILPWAATVLLLWSGAIAPPDPIQRRAMPLAWATLGIFAMYAIASTQDVWALARARVLATKRLEAAGISRTSIDAGFEYNAWTELRLNGRLNSNWVVNPPGAHRPDLGLTPSVVPLYKLEYLPTPESPASKFGSVPFFSFLPPFRKQVSIDRVTGP
jgi:Dolichyl-phosphate-mannose-protein mannosyltransferase